MSLPKSTWPTSRCVGEAWGLRRLVGLVPKGCGLVSGGHFSYFTWESRDLSLLALPPACSGSKDPGPFCYRDRRAIMPISAKVS